jgi:ABC-type dipeptide/oligopeptide/nickel transport system permease subunit
LLHSPAALISTVVLLLIILAAVAAPVLAPYSPLQIDPAARLQGPSLAHLFGTDELGRDLFSRALYGARVSLLTAAIAVVGATIIGVPLGLLGGYFGGWSDALLMRSVDILLSIPAILIAMGLIVILGPSTLNAAIAITVISVPAFARITRSNTLRLRNEDYVTSTRIAGATHGYVLFRTILPNTLAPILVQMTVTGATAILFEAGLSYLGLGTQPPTPSWGQMLSEGQTYLHQAPWYAIAPGVFLTLTVVALDVLSRFIQRAVATQAAP